MSLKLLWTVSTSALSSRGASQNEALACTLVGVSRSHVKCVHSNDRWRKPAVFSSSSVSLGTSALPSLHRRCPHEPKAPLDSFNFSIELAWSIAKRSSCLYSGGC